MNLVITCVLPVFHVVSGAVHYSVCTLCDLCDPHLSALEVRFSRRGAIHLPSSLAL